VTLRVTFHSGDFLKGGLRLLVPQDVHRAKHLWRLRERWCSGTVLSPEAFLPPRNSSVPCTPAAQNGGLTPGRARPVRLHSGQGRRTRKLVPRILIASAGRRAAQSNARGSRQWAQGSCGMRATSLPGPTCFAPLSGSPRVGPVRRTADAPPANAPYFRNLLASKASLRLSISQVVRAIRAARIEMALALPCCFSSRAT